MTLVTPMMMILQAGQFFLPCDAYAAQYAIPRVRLSQVGVLSKRIKAWRCFLAH